MLKYNVFHKSIDLDLLCQIMSEFDSMDASELRLKACDGYAAHMQKNGTLLIGSDVTNMLCDFNQWSDGIFARTAECSTDYIRKFVYAAMCSSELDEAQSKDQRLLAYLEKMANHLEETPLFPVYTSCPGDPYSARIEYQYYFILGHEMAHYLFARNPSYEERICAMVKAAIADNYVDAENKLLYLLESAPHVREMACDAIGALAALGVHEKLETKEDDVVQCAMSIVLAMLSLRHPITAENLIYWDKDAVDPQALSFLRTYGVFLQIVKYLRDRRSPAHASQFAVRFAAYFSKYREIASIVEQEVRRSVPAQSSQ